jgi:NAD(P)-dependent dehydrogenase (short-subunit alcohol dehydrogenase family)
MPYQNFMILERGENAKSQSIAAMSVFCPKTSFVARRARLVEWISWETSACGIVGDVGLKEDIHAMALEIAWNLGALAASAREGRGAVVINISSDAAVSAYPRWGAYGAAKAALSHMTAIWAEEARDDGVRFLSLDPGDMDTPLHALAVPDADPTILKRPEDAAREIVASMLRALRENAPLELARRT